MIEYDVMLDIEADVTSAAKLAQTLGVKEEYLESREVIIDDETKECKLLWMIESDCAREQPLAEHIESILSKVNINKTIRTGGPIKWIDINIGVFYDTAYCLVVLEGELLGRLLARFPEIEVYIRCYEIEFESDGGHNSLPPTENQGEPPALN